MAKAPNKTATKPAVIRSGNQAEILAPNNTAKVLSMINATDAPSITGQGRCREASTIHTSWLLSPISANAINEKVDSEIEKILMVP